MEPVSLVVGGVLLLVGFALGRAHRPAKSTTPDPTKCAGCEHPLTYRDPESGRCTEKVIRAGSWTQCLCRNHVSLDQFMIAGVPWNTPDK